MHILCLSIPKTLKCRNFYIRFRIETIHISLESSRRDLSDGIPLDGFASKTVPTGHIQICTFCVYQKFIPKTLKCHNFYIRFWIETIHISLELSRRDLSNGIPLGQFYLAKPSLQGTYKYAHLCLSINSYQKL